MRNKASGSHTLMHAAVQATRQVSVAINTVSDFWKSFHQDNLKRQRDPFMPAFRSKGEKARNRRKRAAR